PHAGDTRKAGALDLVPDHAGLHHAVGEREIRGRPHRRGDRDDRVIAPIDAPHMHDRLLAWARRIVAGELPERAFFGGHALDHLAFQHDLGMRRHWQAVKLALHDFVRLAAVAAGIVVFGETLLDLVAAG